MARNANLEMIAPQDRQVLEHMEQTGSITQVEAAAVLKVRSVSSNISRLCKAGFNIEREYRKDSQGQRYVRYHLA